MSFVDEGDFRRDQYGEARRSRRLAPRRLKATTAKCHVPSANGDRTGQNVAQQGQPLELTIASFRPQSENGPREEQAMQTESDFWILLVNLSARIDKEPPEQLLDEFKAMSAPTRAIMLRRLRHVVTELSAMDARACESNDE